MNVFMVIFGILIFLRIAKTNISLSPFKITMESPWLAAGWVIVVFGLVLVMVEIDRHAYKRGANDTIELITNQIKQINESKSSEGIQPKE